MIENRVYNFSAGPAILPDEVLLTVKENLLNYQGSGIGLMEMSHRSKDFTEIIETAEANLKKLLDIGDTHEVIFTTGGATNQNSMIPMNIRAKDQVGSYIITGSWAKKSYEEAAKLGQAEIAATSKDAEFNYIPKEVKISDNSAYLHYTSNNTICGTQFKTEPEAGDVPLACDASSDLLHKKIDVNKYGIIYAGAQKNLGPAGVTVVIIRKDLLDRVPDGLPTMMDYRTYVSKKSVYNTPPCFPIYVVGEVFKWLLNMGGLDAIEKKNQEKAALVYEVLDSSDFYLPFAAKEDRSLMNISFNISNKDLEAKLLEEAGKVGLNGIKGHRSVGGFRASMYNAFPLEGAKVLAEFLKDFAKNNG